MTLATDKDSLRHCRRMVEQKLGWSSLDEWRNYEFTELSDKILEVTGVQLSTTTLKRVFGKLRYDNLPSSATLNALAKYLGFENWMQFKANHGSVQTTPSVITSPVISPLKKQLIRKVLLIGALFTLVLITAFGFIVFSENSTTGSRYTAGIVFSSRPLAEGLPNSVVFNIDLKDIKSKNVIIQQSWDSTKTVKLQTGQKEATAQYYIPGYFRAKLIVDGKILREHDLFIRSNEWMATIDHEPIPTYLKKEELILNNGMTVSPGIINEIKGSTKPLTLTYHLVRPFDSLQSDNFTLETSYRNTWSEGPAVCKTSKLFILCTNGAFIIPFTIPGCASNINLKLGDKLWEGRSNDLSAFGRDPSQPLNLKLEVKNRKAKIFLDGKLIREEIYNNDAGAVVGLRYSFLGAGTVDHILLQNEKGIPVYKEDF